MSNLAEKLNSDVDVNSTPVIGLVVDTPYNRIISFINEYESKNTRDAYLRHFKKMFMYTCGKTLEQLTYQDIKSVNDLKVEGFRNHLTDKYKNTTINQIIFACKALYDRFKEKHIVEYNDFDIKPLLEHENSHGSLTAQEIDNLFDYCLKLKYKPIETKLYFEFLYIVTCRKSAAQNLTWNEINKELDVETGKLVWVVTFLDDKKKEVKKAIQDEFYNRLKENYKSEKEISGKVFNIYNKTYDNVLKGFCKEYGISEKRNIHQHSLKSSGLDHIMNVTGDINTVALAGQHKNINTSYKRYINKNRRYSEHPSYYLNKNFNIDMLKDLSKDELLSLIEKSGKETVIRMCLEMEKRS
jgi:site-specific recombinase XerD